MASAKRNFRRKTMRKDKETRRRELYDLLGDLPDRDRTVSAVKVMDEERETFVLEKLVLDLNSVESVPAYFAYPKKEKGPFPTILYNHAHGGNYPLGKNELLLGHGEAFQKPPYAEELTRRGCAALCIDHWAFGERKGRTESEIFKLMLWRGQVMWGMMVFDSIKAVDYLVSRPDVDADRLGTLGLSMGSTMAWWVAALDTRIKVCVDLCCLTDYQALIETRGLDGHGIYYYVPRLLNHFSTAQINALIAPRAHLSLAGNYDKLTPPAGLDRIDAELNKVYAAEGAPDAWRLLRYEIGHFETAEMRKEIISFLGDRL
ncbi:MAG: acetylxylan esterase [Planctomycetota bacterium]